MPGMPLRRLQPQPLEPSQINGLRELGVTTAEELLALAAVRANRSRLASYLDLSASELRKALAAVRKQLDPQVVAEMERPVPGGHRHGVLDGIVKDKRRSR